jgi:nucleoside-diphosphate-sugar epimerase
MRVVIIGGTGHVGTYLVPRLVNQGYEVVSVSRQKREPYQPHAAWGSVKYIQIDRVKAEKRGDFGEQILALAPDIVIDMICFTPKSAKGLLEALRGRVKHFLHCGTIWVHGPSKQVPTDENQPRDPFGEYGINKAAIEDYLLGEARQNGFPGTILHPGHIVGPGWIPLNPAGNFNPDVFRKLARGDELCLPNLGMETVHHVHADDVAQAFIQAIVNWRSAVGESFHVVSSQALTLRGYALAISKWFGKDPNFVYLPWKEWKKTVSKEDARATWDHIAHSPNCSIAKAQQRLNYQPRYSSLQAVEEAVRWLIEYDELLPD